ncbi:FAD-dependent oxidoreductase [Xylophilus rhododendri]|uniref:FAD-dependent oxidoreductase n=1 Tax=Xylophilus rhododendri TaxID=2697032 RepID=A0A857J6Q5_9BURK|nr:FAD-dependent oxidoreductase [Xylophilus rhododendri]QHI99690.1 FAD-dependent oxidoreductase [Xylophilus rhododendri]
MAAAERTGVLIVGAGQAGAMAAAALRGFAYAGRIVMVGSEPDLPYERPPLSKAMLAGEGAVEQIQLHPTGFHQEKDIETWLSAAVQSLDTSAQTATLADGRAIAYEHCLLATGGTARVVPGLPEHAPRVHYLRSVADALRLREALRRHASLLVIGGGFLGLEVASTAQSMGLDTTVLERGGRLLERVLPPVAGDWLRQRVELSGVRLRLDAACESFELGEQAVTATLASGERVSADIVVVAVGQVPDVALAREAGIDLHPANQGIRIDARCATSAPNLYAAGDCTSQHHPFLGSEQRLESWQSANEQARIAAAAIAGAETHPLAAPWFWSDQFGCNLQMQGLPAPGLSYHCRGGLSSTPPELPKFLLLGTDPQQRIVHAIAVNAGGDLRQLKPLIDGRVPCDIVSLCNPAAALKAQVRSALAQHTTPAIS